MLIVLNVAAPAGAADVVNAAFKAPSIDLMPVLQAVESTKPQVQIELPPDLNGQKLLMTLDARGTGKVHRWAVFTLRNPDQTERDLVLSVPHQGFVGSGILWPQPQGSRILGVQVSNNQQLTPIPVLSADTFALTVNPGVTVTYAMELSSTGLSGVTLWQRNPFDAQTGEYAFFRGAVLGIGIVIGIGILCLFLVRPRAVFPSAALFAWASVAFLTLDAGYLPHLAAWFPGLARADHTVRAVVECLMLLGITLCLVTFVELRRRMPLLGYSLIGVAGAAVALTVYAAFQPEVASGIARLGFVGVVVTGLAAVGLLWQEGVVRAQASLLFWAALTVWTLLAAFGCLDSSSGIVIKQVIAAGMILVLITLAFTLAHFAFSQGINSGRFLSETGRRALALAGSEQAVWDWQSDRGELYVGPELERALGYEAGSVSGSELRGWLELIHPSDRLGYVSTVEAAERRGRGSLSQEFRLRRGDGSYRWYLLRARAMAGEEGSSVRLIGTLSDVTSVRRSEDRILSDAVRDRVTGLPNRALFLDRLERAMRQARNEGNYELHVIVIDLDRFKNVNEGLGHEIGDSLLAITGRRLASQMGLDDTLARLPGDQFGVIFNGLKPQRDIMHYAEGLRLEVSAPVALRPRDIFLTASIGVANLRVEQASAEDFLKDAEIALYEAKRRGKDTIEFFRSHMRDERSELLALEQDMHRAIERNEIEVVYQPVMRLTDRELAGFEALARWRRGSQLLAPEAFMGIAEETGVIREIGKHVLGEAARQLGIWQRAFRPNDPIFVSVNVSSSQLLNNDLLEEAKTILSREDIKPATLKLELTESLVMENPELSAKMLQRFKQLGMGLACDDFGTGYSALANLRRLPFDTLKLDRSFLEADPEDERASLILEAIILLAHDLDLTVIAEGVESGDQIDKLAELECDFAQGYFIGEPVTAKQVIDALGGLPYNMTSRRFGMAAFWDRLLGRTAKPAEPAAPPAPPAVPKHAEAEVWDEEPVEPLPPLPVAPYPHAASVPPPPVWAAPRQPYPGVPQPPAGQTGSRPMQAPPAPPRAMPAENGQETPRQPARQVLRPASPYPPAGRAPLAPRPGADRSARPAPPRPVAEAAEAASPAEPVPPPAMPVAAPFIVQHAAPPAAEPEPSAVVREEEPAIPDDAGPPPAQTAEAAAEPVTEGPAVGEPVFEEPIVREAELAAIEIIEIEETPPAVEAEGDEVVQVVAVVEEIALADDEPPPAIEPEPAHYANGNGAAEHAEAHHAPEEASLVEEPPQHYPDAADYAEAEVVEVRYEDAEVVDYDEDQLPAGEAEAFNGTDGPASPAEESGSGARMRSGDLRKRLRDAARRRGAVRP